MINLFKVFMASETGENVTNVLNSGMITQGQKVEEFEKMLKQYFNFDNILTLNSATSGLTLAVRLLNLTSDDEIISTPLTCFATTCPILANNIKIIWADVDKNNININLQSIREKLSSKTKAIMVVHWGGYPVNLDELSKIQDECFDKFGHRPAVIEDCAHAFGATINNKFIGTSHNNICVFSLQAIKHLTTGDGGLIFLPTKELYERARLLRWFGIDRDTRNKGDFRMEPDIAEWGYKFHMNDINATIGICNLPYVNNNLKKLRENSQRYDYEFKNLSPYLILFENDKNMNSACWLYSIKIKNKSEFISYMKNNNIMVSQVHNRNDNHSCVSNFKCGLPILDDLEKELICIPNGWWLTEEELKKVIRCVKEFCYQNLKIEELDDKLPSNEYSQYLDLMYQLTTTKYNVDPKFNNGNTTAFLEKLHIMKHQNSKIFIGKFDNKIICTVKIFIEEKFEDNVAHIEDVVVDENYRGGGLCKKIVDYATHYAKQYKCYKIVLNCKDELYKIYENCNFERKGVHCTIYLK